MRMKPQGKASLMSNGYTCLRSLKIHVTSTRIIRRQVVSGLTKLYQSELHTSSLQELVLT